MATHVYTNTTSAKVLQESLAKAKVNARHQCV